MYEAVECFFFFKQKTAYEMRISDWSSDVCSSDLLDFELFGEKLNGKWHLVRLKPKPREKADNWLLIKSDDDAARAEDDPDILEERPESVKTGRTVDEIAGEAPGWSSKTGKIAPPRRSEEHTSELPSLMRLSNAVLCLTQQKHTTKINS